jgi:DNA modification methylase
MTMDEQSYKKILSGTLQTPTSATPVLCLGLSFPNDDARRDHFREELRKKLSDPDFRKISGFPNGNDEDILALSDPPYFTACPNPWTNNFITFWESQKAHGPDGYKYHREPFAADVSEGKNDPIYNAHSYHTKVPHKAIMKYILHYTEPGDIIFDGFCGTGMTGIAAQMCARPDVISELGYKVLSEGTIHREEIDEAGKSKWVSFSKIGERHAVLSDLSPAATFISYNYNMPIDMGHFESESSQIAECGKKAFKELYLTQANVESNGIINYTVWSDVFICNECSSEINFWDSAVDKVTGEVLDKFDCPKCSKTVTKRSLDRAWKTVFDPSLQTTIRQAKSTQVLINYTKSGKRMEKKPDANDIKLVEKIDSMQIESWFPVFRMIEGRESRRNDPAGITHIHHFFTRRNLTVFSKLFELAKMPLLKCALLGGYTVGLKTSRFLPLRWINKDTGPMKPHTAGTLYVPSLNGEQNWINVFESRIQASKRAQIPMQGFEKSTVIETCSATSVQLPSCSIDYIFLDPPFGSNLQYSELNCFWESWIKVWTNIQYEAVESDTQGKGTDEYRKLMTECFSEAYRILKPGRWMTVEFSNTKASVWNGIQTALTEAGFIVANVSALDKKQGSFKAVTTPTAVKQDLVISSYKPNGGFEERFVLEAKSEDGVWDFIRTHLKYLPITKQQGLESQIVLERDPRILFDQMISYFVRRGYPIPISSVEFQNGLAQRFIERDGMYFLPEQAAHYDRRKIGASNLSHAPLFVSDEASAIQWLREILKDKPLSFQDLNPQFMQQIGGWNKNEQQLDLRELLNQNFLVYDGVGLVPEQIHAYLSSNWKELRNLAKDNKQLVEKARDRWYVPDPNKASDLEKLREKSLLKEFIEYREIKKKLKIFRIEAVRAGFKKAWQDRDYTTIISVARKIPDSVLQEDPKLLMWYDQAITRVGQG